ncbi:MAG: hemolysin family protein [Acidobacteriota bacterium]|nr:hemolysin family protein [Acidobacteriota bacterium]
MNPAAFNATLGGLLIVLALASYVDRIYSEMGKFLAREYQDNIDSWTRLVEPRLRLGRESIALSASVLRQVALAAIALLSGLRLYALRAQTPLLARAPGAQEIALTAFLLIVLIVFFDRLIPQILFARTRGTWIARIRFLLEALFYVILPITLTLSLLLSIAALAEPEDAQQQQPDHSEAMDALLEAGEEEGILEESDRELVRSVVEFGDKVVREIMTPRPDIFAVPGTLTLDQFLAQLKANAFSRVPVYSGVLDHITGIAFARDLLHALDSPDAPTSTVAHIQRQAAFVPETKNVAQLLREMQHEKQHMRLVIDEYGAVAGVVTIEDLLETIVGNIADEHDEHEGEDAPVRDADGTFLLPGSFDVSRLRELLTEPAPDHEDLRLLDDEDSSAPILSAPARQPQFLRQQYEATTVGGLVSEIAGHIPHPGELVEHDGLRVEVLASTDRKVERVRVSLADPA